MHQQLLSFLLRNNVIQVCHTVYLFISWGTFGLFPLWAYSEEYCYEHWWQLFIYVFMCLSINPGVKPFPLFLPGESPWTEKPGGLQSMVSQRVRHSWSAKQQQPSYSGLNIFEEPPHFSKTAVPFYICTVEYYSVIKKEWNAVCSNMMDLEITILSDVRQRQISLVLYTEYYVCVYMYYIQNLKKNFLKNYKINIFTKQKQNELTVTRGQERRNRLGV